jgi:uncharacterized protein (TIGR00297 family)
MHVLATSLHPAHTVLRLRRGAPARQFTRVMGAAVLSAALAAWLAHRLRLLTGGGAVAAALVGAAAVNAGARWVGLLLLFFVSASLLSRWRATERELRVGSIVEKGRRRDAWQVVANGGVFAGAAVLASVLDGPTWQAAGAGAIAAATCDTWGTEIGTILAASPRHVLTGRPVRPGTSGAVSLPGTAATALAAACVALVAAASSWSTPALAIAAGGIGGSVVDSLVGATLQERRWCDSCGTETEQRRHRCGTPTRHHGGIRGLDNDMVNLTGTLAGAALAVWWAA